MEKKNIIKFTKPSLEAHEDCRILTPEYAFNTFKKGRIVQINLDNCSIQRMELLPNNSTLRDVEQVGLMPLVNILNACPISLTAMGVDEMPDIYVKNSNLLMKLFVILIGPGTKMIFMLVIVLLMIVIQVEK